jgi:hypothetical protein
MERDLTKYDLVELTNKEIVEQGGVYLGTDTDFNNHYDGYIEQEVYLLNGKQVASNIDWKFLGR